ncbi:MAG TPA: hypothetical protein ENH51_05155 [Euryarchaeota archaeon]|nr:hypothetical protein [Euryarchaeota archaeon]
MVSTLDLRITATLVLLIYASVLDLRSREINRLAWQSMTGLGLILLIVDLAASKSLALLITAAIILGIAVVFAVSIHYLGLMGGGDAKLLIGLGAMFPTLPPGTYVLPAFFLTVFSNAIIVSLLVPIAFFLRNLGELRGVRSARDFLRLFIAYQKDSKDLGRFETVLDEGQLFINAREVELGETEDTGRIWATPALPFVVFLTLGFIISVLHGDLIAFIF